MTRNANRTITLFLWLASAGIMGWCGYATAGAPVEVTMLQSWQGDYPVAQLDRLPRQQRAARTGYIGDSPTFERVWRAFRPGESTPAIDFDRQLVVFSRNIRFYNRTAIIKILLKDGVADILARETRTAMPIQDKAAMAMAVIARNGVTAIQADNGIIPVTGPRHKDTPNPLNTSYIIDGKRIQLLQGRAEQTVAPGSAARYRVQVTGNPGTGDLDDDGNTDTALALVTDSGGSGTFYYIAVAHNTGTEYRGGNAVLLGDRIVLRDIAIRNGLVIVRYLDRDTEAPKSATPGRPRTMVLQLENDELIEKARLSGTEQLLEGWVRIGHEVRTFTPCGKDIAYWIRGDSPAYPDIATGYRETRPDAAPYSPVFMVLGGKLVDAASEEFGADYTGAIVATRRIAIHDQGIWSCRATMQ